MRIRHVTILSLLLLPLLLSAQAPRFEFTAQAVVFPVRSDFTDASAGDHRIGAGVRLGYRPEFAGGRALLEAHLTATPTGDLPTESGLRSFGVLVATIIGPVGGAIEGSLGVGIGRLNIEAHGEELCLWPTCVVDRRIPVQPSVVDTRAGDEVRDLTRDASYAAMMVDAGIRILPGRTLGGRLGVRLYAPTDTFRSGTSEDRPATRWELSLGMLLRAW